MADGTPPPIRLYLLDDHTLFREGLRRLLDADARFAVVGHGGSIAQSLAEIDTLCPDVVIVDYDLGEHTALDFAREPRRSASGSLLVVTAGLPERDALELIRLGISGICRKEVSPDELKNSIHAVAMGQVLIEQRYLQAIVTAAQEPARVGFTERERAVLRGLLQGLSNKQIGRRLGSSESAVKASFQQLFNKLDVRSRSQLVMVVIQNYRDLI
ncbi:MAG: response regulator transcription factor [Ferrovibrio sp.]|uniref:LuxR C-terminal-related transcriptional regulator n=1 Tax=Ferrovibrio sp. TaxID=1917215 RepID=UPI00261888C3|nr:response regulator transcription factor [Ferrovibrio sp.]MCW0235763.1 response regulator transcription factor [Ferrovibrio sp.]